METVYCIAMYIYLIVSTVMPFSILLAIAKGNKVLAIIEGILLVIVILAVNALSIVCIVISIINYKNGDYAKVKKMAKKMKVYTIPFYVINFFAGIISWGSLVAISWGLLAILVPIPIILTNILVIYVGVVGCLYVSTLRKNIEEKPGIIHYILQFISVLDVCSMIYLMRKYKDKEMYENER